MNEKSSPDSIIKWIVIGILAIVALKLVFTVFGIAFLLGGFLLFKVLPLVLVAWVVMRVIRWFRDSRDPGSPPSTIDV